MSRLNRFPIRGSVIAMATRSFLLAAAFAVLVSQAAWALPAPYQGSWLEEGQSCANVFVAKGRTISFKRPANAFASGFVIRGRQLSTPLATCWIGRITPAGERQVLDLSCTTSIATNSARAIFALAQDGGLHRYGDPEGGSATRYRRCTPETLKAP